MTPAAAVIPCPRNAAPAPPTPAARIEIASDAAALNALRDDWSDLAGRAGLTSPTGHPARFIALLGSADGAVGGQVLVTRRGPSIAGLVAARRIERRLTARLGYWRIPTLRLRCLDAVHGGLIGLDDSTLAAPAAHRLLEDVRRGRIDLLTVHRAPPDHPLIREVEAASEQAPWRIERHVEPHATMELVPNSFDATIRQALTRKRRHEVRREARVLERAFGEDVRVEVLRGPDDVERIMAWTAQVSDGTYKDRLGIAPDGSAQWRAMLSSAAAAGWLRAWFLLARGEPIAYVLGSVIDDRCHVEATGFRPEHGRLSPGKHIYLRAAAHLCDEGVRWLDFGPGDAGYKRVLATEWDDLVTLRIFARTPAAHVTRWMIRSIEAAHVAAARTAGRLGRLDAARRWWRRRLERPRTRGNDS